MKLELIHSGEPSDTCAFFYSEHAWLNEHNVLKSKLGSDFTAKWSELVLVYDVLNFKRVFLVGLGESEKMNLETFRKAASLVAVKVKQLKLKTLQLDLDHGFVFKDSFLPNAILEGLLLGQYSFVKYSEKEKREQVLLQHIVFKHAINSSFTLKSLQDSLRVIENTLRVRDWVNSSSDEMNSLEFEKIARALARSHKLKITVLGNKEIHTHGLGLLEAVNRGSRFPARLIILQYAGASKSDPWIALVGKGITFDSGGLNLKPTGSMEDMRMDMAGAATVLGVVKSLSELNIKQNVLGVMAVTENMIGSNAYKPGDVFKAYNGKTVEIKNTDAEGRLVLADAIAYTVKNYKPDFIIDLATLTGACLVCLGELAAGMISNVSEQALHLQKFSHTPKVFERAWLLPSYEEAKESLKGTISDLANTGFEKGYASTITGGLFICEFVEDTPWIHLDIAGTGMVRAQQFYLSKGGTGFGVRLLVNYLSQTQFAKKCKK